jgi:hypothetical protein
MPLDLSVAEAVVDPKEAAEHAVRQRRQTRHTSPGRPEGFQVCVPLRAIRVGPSTGWRIFGGSVAVDFDGGSWWALFRRTRID